MGESKPQPNDFSADQDQKVWTRKIYLKDLSFESPNTRDVFSWPGPGDIAPVMRTRFGITHTRLDEQQYEVVLRLTVHATKDDEKSIFLLELEQAGIFHIRGVSGDELTELLEVRCPRAIYPFAREVVWSIVSRGGFPNLLLQDIDFGALFRLD